MQVGGHPAGLFGPACPGRRQWKTVCAASSSRLDWRVPPGRLRHRSWCRRTTASPTTAQRIRSTSRSGSIASRISWPWTSTDAWPTSCSTGWTPRRTSTRSWRLHSGSLAGCLPASRACCCSTAFRPWEPSRWCASIRPGRRNMVAGRARWWTPSHTRWMPITRCAFASSRVTWAMPTASSPGPSKPTTTAAGVAWRTAPRRPRFRSRRPGRPCALA